MRQRPVFKFLCMLTLWFYCCTIANAGQVITNKERDWAKQAIAQETQLGGIESSQSIAVLYFHNKTAQQKLDALQKGLALMLITDLSKIDSFYVVERARLQALLDEGNLGKAGLVDERTAPRVGKLLKAYYVVGGDIREESATKLKFDSRLIDIPFESTTVIPPVLGAVDEIIRMEKDLLFSIVDRLKISVSPEKKKELAVPLSLSLAALLALFVGIDASDQGNYDKAAEMYNRALAEDPGLELAQSSLQELKDMGLVSSQDLSQADFSTETAAAEGGTSWGTIGAIALGLAVVGGGVALLASSDSDDDGGNDGQTTGDGPTVAPDKTLATCLGDSVIFNFSETMNPTGTASVEWVTGTGSITFNDWETDQMYIVTWSGDSPSCGAAVKPSLKVSFNPKSFTSADGATLTGTTTYTIQTQ